MFEINDGMSRRMLALPMPVNGETWRVALFRDVTEARSDNEDDFGPATMAWQEGHGMWTLFDENMVGCLSDEALDHLWKLCARFRRFAFNARKNGVLVSPVEFSEGRVPIDEAIAIASRFMLVAGSYATSRREGEQPRDSEGWLIDTDGYGLGIEFEDLVVLFIDELDTLRIQADTEGDGLVLWISDVAMLVERDLQNHKKDRLHEGIWRLTDFEDRLEAQDPESPIVSYVLQLRYTAWQEAMRRR